MFESMSAAVYRPICVSSSKHRPGHVGAAVAVGAACGMLLTKSLLGPLLLLTLYFLPVHLPVALLSAGLVAAFSGLFDPVAGTLGSWCLKISPVRQWIAGLQAYPFAAWMRLNNSVVHGYLLVAIGQMLPTFLFFRQLMRRVRQLNFATNYPNFRAHQTHQTPPVSKQKTNASSGEDHGGLLDSRGRDSILATEQIFRPSSTAGKTALDTVNRSDSENKLPIEEDSGDAETDEIMAVHQAGNRLNRHAKPTGSALPIVSTAEADLAHESKAGIETVGEPPPFASEEHDHVIAENPEDVQQEDSKTVAEEIRQLLTETSASNASANTSQVAARASVLAELVSNMLTDLDTIKADSAPSTSSGEESWSESYSTNGGSGDKSDMADEAVSSEPVAHVTDNDVKHETSLTPSPEDDQSSRRQQVAEQEEALRYLLLHLKEIQEKV